MFDKMVRYIGRMIGVGGKLDNFKTPASLSAIPTESVTGYCFVCGVKGDFISWEPIDFPCKRNTFICNNCGSSARNRHIVKVLLDTFSTNPPSHSLSEFSSHTNIKIFNASANGAIHHFLNGFPGYNGSEFIENVPSGQVVNGIQCQDIQKTSFLDHTFDVVITEDVLEHVPDPLKACTEIRRILKSGGWHLATIPVLFHLAQSVTRASINDGEICHILSPEYHLDPCRHDGVLVFTDFGKDLVGKYLETIGTTIVYESYKNAVDESRYAIYDNWVYASQKS